MNALLLSLCMFAAARGAAEIPETYRDAWGAYLQGRAEDSASGYRYLATLGVDGVAPTVNLALLARDEGKPGEALPLWTKATLLAPEVAFLWSQRGWCYLSMGRAGEARDSFKKAAEVSDSAPQTAEAYLGLGLTEERDSNFKAAVEAFQAALPRSPFLLPAASAWLGRLAVRLGRLNGAERYLKQSFNQDPMQPEVLRELARVYQEQNATKAAWLAYRAVLEVDPKDAAARKGYEKTSRYLREPVERALPARRLARPLMAWTEPPPASDARNTVRVGLFADAAGAPRHVRRFYFISGSDFKIIDLKLNDEVTRGRALDQWSVELRPETNILELRDAHGAVQYTTKQPFRVEPADPGATVLIKTAELSDYAGVDAGDREVRGAVEAVPTPQGVHLVNEVGVEQYLYGQVAAAVPYEHAPPEALRAQAVLSRTRLEEFRRPTARDALLRMDLCDSAHCQRYVGLPQERHDATQAVQDTQGGRLARGGRLVGIRQHPYCAGVTEDGVSDRAENDSGAASHPPASVYELEISLHGPPEKDAACEASALVAPNWARWVRILDAAELRTRLPAEPFIGRIHDVRALRRSASGRVEALKVIGARGKTVLEGRSAIEDFLSPSSLRSTLFTLQPLYQGRALQRLLVWGAGTGDGRGACVAGMLGLGALGKGFREILQHYYPGAVVEGVTGAAAAAAGKKGRETRRRDLREKLRKKAKGG